jgi:ribosome-associated translation inhibitor RaiA
MIELGGNIKLSGFSEQDMASLIVIKKLVGNFVKHFAHSSSVVASFDLTRKDIHKTKGSTQHEVKGKLTLTNGKILNVEHIDRNLYVTLDRVFKKIEAAARK